MTIVYDIQEIGGQKVARCMVQTFCTNLSRMSRGHSRGEHDNKFSIVQNLLHIIIILTIMHKHKS